MWDNMAINKTKITIFYSLTCIIIVIFNINAVVLLNLLPIFLKKMQNS